MIHDFSFQLRSHKLKPVITFIKVEIDVSKYVIKIKRLKIWPLPSAGSPSRLFDCCLTVRPPVLTGLRHQWEGVLGKRAGDALRAGAAHHAGHAQGQMRPKGMHPAWRCWGISALLARNIGTWTWPLFSWAFPFWSTAPDKGWITPAPPLITPSLRHVDHS